MPALGVYFALDEAQLQQLLGRADQDELRSIVDDLEDAWDDQWTQEADEAWDAMDRVLSKAGAPLSLAVTGGEDLSGDPDFVASLVRPARVKELSAALEPLDEAWFRARYDALEGYTPHADEDDFEYTWDWFLEVRELFRQAAEAGRAVLFTVER